MANPVRAKGWTVEADHPDGPTLYPEVVDSVEWQPRLNGLPRIEIPVEKGDAWEGTSMDEQPIRVWFDGSRVPIDEIVRTEREPDQDVIVARGGSELDQYVDGIEIFRGANHTEAKQIIQDETSYAVNFDTPSTTTNTDVLLQETKTTSDFEDNLADYPFPATSPLQLKTGPKVVSKQTADIVEAESMATSASVPTDSGWSGSEAVQLKNDGETLSTFFEIDYDIPLADAEWLLAFGNPNKNPKLKFVLELDSNARTGPDVADGKQIIKSEGAFDATSSKTDLTSEVITVNDDGVIPPGKHDLIIEVQSTVTDGIYIDFTHMRDGRYDYTEDLNPSNGDVSGWEQYPDIPVTFDRATTFNTVTGGKATISMNNTQAQQKLQIRNALNQNYLAALNSTTVDKDFALKGSFIQLEVILSATDSGSGTGEYGDQPQELQDATVYADTDETPTVFEKSYHDKLVNILNDLAGETYIWEVTWNESAGKPQVEWTQPGSRTQDEPSLVSYDAERTSERSYQKIRVIGDSKEATDRRFTVNTATKLEAVGENWVVPGSETVYEVGQPDNTFTRGVDYKMRYQKGAIEPLGPGSLSEGTEYAIDYRHKAVSEFTAPDASDPRMTERNLPSVATDREADQAAKQLVDDLKDPLEEASVTVENPGPKTSLVDAIQTRQLPLDGPLKINSLDQSPDSVRLTLGSRDSIGDAIARLQRKISETGDQL